MTVTSLCIPTPRSYQADLIQNVRAAFMAGNKRVLMQLPTGGGKTITFCSIIHSLYNKGHRAAVIAHRQELIYQSQKSLSRFNLPSGIIMAGHEMTSHRLQVASIQTLARRLHYQMPSPDLIIVDECHHISTGNQYHAVFERFPNALVLGVTATPCRLDGKGLGDIFQALVHGPQIAELIEMGALVRPKYFTIPSALDLSGVRTSHGEYNQKDLAEAVSKSQINGDLVAHWKQYADGLSTVVFAVNVEHSQAIAAEYRAAGIAAHHVDANTSPEHRAALLDGFAKGRFQVLVNVGIVTEGFDLPSIACVQLARPTKSVALMFQMVGRALRPNAGKDHAIILDHVGAYQEHGSILDPVYWELSQTKPRKKREADEINFERKPHVITCDGSVKLIEIGEDSDPSWLTYLNGLTTQQRERGNKPMWIYYRFIERYSSPSLDQLKVIAKVVGYHHRWAIHKFRDLNQSRDIEEVA